MILMTWVATGFEVGGLFKSFRPWLGRTIAPVLTQEVIYDMEEYLCRREEMPKEPLNVEIIMFVIKPGREPNG